MPDINWTILDPPERERKYLYSDGTELVFQDVTKIEIRESGKHRIETADGIKAFVCPGWVALILDVDEWTC